MRSPLRMPAALAAGLVTACLVAGCGSGQAPAAPTAAAASQDPTMPGMSGMNMDGPALWAVQSGPLGIVTTDNAGHLLYRSDADESAPPTSNCIGACARTWIPMTVQTGQQPELNGVDATKVGQLARPDGSVQLTLGGWPLYYNRTDTLGLETTDHNGADGTWFAISPTGGKAAG